MATRIRLQRHGKKGKPFFHLVVADSRAKRDGKFIEKLGTYNPTANPAIIDINFESTLKWVQTGAEMTDTARAILSYKGVLFKNHLLKGVTKGALTAEQVEERFSKWEDEKSGKIDAKKTDWLKNAAADKEARLKAEGEANAAKAKAIEDKNTPPADEPVAEAEENTEAADEATEEVTAAEESAPESAEAAPETEENTSSEEQTEA